VNTSGSDEESRIGATCAAGFEFVEGWNVGRILAAVVLMVILAIAAALLWVFLGVTFLGGVGFRGAGSRVGESMLVGGLVLMVGWTVVAAWMGVSWVWE
jgi:hypothetical protein